MNNRRPSRPAPKSTPRLMVWKDQAKLDAQDPTKKPVDMDEFNRLTRESIDPATVKTLEKLGVPAKKILSQNGKHPLFGKKF